MGFTKKVNQDFFIEDNHIKLSPEYLQKNKSKFKKITGTRFGAILGSNKFSSPVQTWATMVNIYSVEMEKLFAESGWIIEPKIHDWVCKKLNINFKQYDPKKISFDVFKNDPIFGGIPDGEPVDDTGCLLYPDLPILEIKTSSIDSFVFKKDKNNFILMKNSDGSPKIKVIGEKKAKWFDIHNNIIIPQEYMFQLGLYCYLRNTNKGLFAICFLESDDYIKPHLCDVENRDIRLIEFNVDLQEFKLQIEYAKKWYATYISKGISPKMTREDIIWFENEVFNNDN